jgi:hypothetical protein
LRTFHHLSTTKTHLVKSISQFISGSGMGDGLCLSNANITKYNEEKISIFRNRL